MKNLWNALVGIADVVGMLWCTVLGAVFMFPGGIADKHFQATCGVGLTLGVAMLLLIHLIRDRIFNADLNER